MIREKIAHKKIFICMVGIILVLIPLIIYIYQTSSYNPIGKISTSSNMSVRKKALIVKVNEESLGVMEINNNNLYDVNFADEGNIGFKQGQEVLIYFNGLFTGSSSVPTISNVGKIEIVKEQSNMMIPDEAIKVFYNSYENVSISLDEITQSKLVFTIIDMNELPYDYSNAYRIYEENIEGNKFLNSVVVSSENTISSGTVLMKEVTRVPNVDDSLIIATIEKVENGIKYLCDWENIYGKLDERIL